MKQFLIGLSKIILGVLTAFILLSLAGVATARYFMGRLSMLPPRPTFENDFLTPDVQTVPPPSSISVNSAPNPGFANIEATPNTTLELGAYRAIVIQPIGLVIREEPNTAARQVGGVDYDTEVIVLEDSDDKRWIHIRVADTGQAGWVKAGNTRQIE